MEGKIKNLKHVASGLFDAGEDLSDTVSIKDNDTNLLTKHNLKDLALGMVVDDKLMFDVIDAAKEVINSNQIKNVDKEHRLSNSVNKMSWLKDSLIYLDKITQAGLAFKYSEYFIESLGKVPSIKEFRKDYEKQLRLDLVETAFNSKSPKEIEKYYE